MNNVLVRFLLIIIFALQMSPVEAREGDTLEPIAIDKPALETFPENLLEENDFRAIEGRVHEARNSGVPLAVRVVDMALPATDLPYPVRQYASGDLSQPLSEERQQAIADSWINSEAIETSEGANDGFLLLVLVPKDHADTQAIWWTGDNALPLNGLTNENISATLGVMNEEFSQGNVTNGVYLGVSEFSYNVQFGVPNRLVRSDLVSALHRATIPLAIGTALSGLAVPILGWWLSRKNRSDEVPPQRLSAWEAAALHLNRATPSIPAAMLLEGVHAGTLTPLRNGGVRIGPGPTNEAIEALRAFADVDDVVPAAVLYDIEAVTAPVRDEIENAMAASGAMTASARTDRTWMLLAMGFAMFMMLLAVVPTIVSMTALGVLAFAITGICLVIGWWWIGYRSYTSPTGKVLLEAWREDASPHDRHLFDTAIHLDLLTDQVGGPDANNQTRLVRQLRGFGAG